MPTRLTLGVVAATALTAGAVATTAQADTSTPRNAQTENTWQPTSEVAFDSDQRRWGSLMDAQGRGTIFYGGEYRDYEVATGRLGAARTLARGNVSLQVDGIGNGHQCATWDGDFGVAMGCRESTSAPWVKVNVSRASDAEAIDIAVAADGRSAVIVWARVARSKAKIYASRFTFASGRLSKSVTLSNPVARRLPLTTDVVASGRSGFLVAYGKQGDDPDRAAATYLQSTLDGRTWNNLVPVRMQTPDGRYRKVVLTELRSRSFGAFGLATQVIIGEPTEWMLATLNGSAVLPVATLPPMRRPTLAVVGDRATVVGASPTSTDLLAYRTETRVTTTIAAPTLPEGAARIGDFAAIGQTSGPRAGFTVVAEYYAYDETDERADHLYAVSGFNQSPEGGIDVGSFTELTSRPSYEEGMSPRIAGGGRYALVVYGASGEVRFGVRTRVGP